MGKKIEQGSIITIRIVESNNENYVAMIGCDEWYINGKDHLINNAVNVPSFEKIISRTGHWNFTILTSTNVAHKIMSGSWKNDEILRMALCRSIFNHMKKEISSKKNRTGF